MKATMKEIGATALKVTGVACVTTGIVAAGAVLACGAAVGSLAEGFVIAKKAAEDIWKRGKTQAEDEEESTVEEESAEETIAEEEPVKETSDEDEAVEEA